MKTLKVIVTGIVVFSLLGCATPQREVKVLNLDETKSSVLTYPSDLRGAYIPKTNASLKFCAEPAPDVALDSLQKLATSLQANLPSGVSGGASISTEFSSKVVELAGRTQLLLIAREMLFRACELSLNYPSEKDEAFKLYREVVTLINNLGIAEKTQAAANKAQADAKLAKALHDASTTIDELTPKGNK